MTVSSEKKENKIASRRACRNGKKLKVMDCHRESNLNLNPRCLSWLNTEPSMVTLSTCRVLRFFFFTSCSFQTSYKISQKMSNF